MNYHSNETAAQEVVAAIKAMGKSGDAIFVAHRNPGLFADSKIELLSVQYHDVRPDRSLYERLVRAGKVERLLVESEVIEAMGEPPASTRAYFRRTCLARWADSVVAAN